MIFDGLTFIGESLFGARASAAQLISRMDELGIDRSVVCGFKPREYRIERANDEVAEAVRASSGRLVGFVRVDPHLGEAEVERGLDELGLQGVFLHPWEETFRISGPLVNAILQVASDKVVPVLVAAGYPWLSEAPQIGELARRFPNVRVIATNGGQINISGLGQIDAEVALDANANLAVQTTGVYREDFLENVVERFGAERLIFASSFPLLDPALEIRRVTWAHFAERDAELILGGNLSRLLGVA